MVEARGQTGYALFIETVTDNKQRTRYEIQRILVKKWVSRCLYTSRNDCKCKVGLLLIMVDSCWHQLSTANVSVLQSRSRRHIQY